MTRISLSRRFIWSFFVGTTFLAYFPISGLTDLRSTFSESQKIGSSFKLTGANFKNFFTSVLTQKQPQPFFI